MKRASFALVLGLSACRRGVDSAPVPARSSSPSVASAAPSPTATGSASPALTFHVVADAPDPFALHPLPGGAFVHAGAFFAGIVDGRIRQEPRFTLGLENFAEVARLEGEWPRGAYAVLTITPKSTPWAPVDKTYRFYESRWSPAPFPLHDAPPLALVPWSDGRTLSLRRDGKGGVAFELVRAMAPGRPPEIPPGGDGGCASPIRDEDVVAIGFPSGDVIVSGRDCGRGPAKSTVLRWTRGSVHAAIDTLPGGGCDVTVTKLRGSSIQGVVAVGRCGDEPWAGRFDGSAWKKIDLPPIGALVDAALESDVLFVADAAKVVAGEHDWVEIPRDDRTGAITSLLATSSHDVWITQTAANGSELLATHASGPMLHVPDKRTMWESRATTGTMLATTACRELFAAIVSIGKSGGFLPDDFPFVRELAKGHADLDGASFVVDDDGSQMMLGAVVPSLEVGEKVLGLFAARVGNAGAKVSCHVPHVVAKLRFDLRTGELVR